MRRYWAVAGLALLLVAACGDDDDAVETGSTTTEATATTDPADTTTTAPPLGFVATLFPADDVEDTPEGAALGFMARYFPGANVSFGEFAEGDGESGEIEVLGGGEGGGANLLRSTLLLRQVDGGWHVIAAVNPNVAITEPEAQTEVVRGQPLVVEGVGRGFEATIVVRVETIDGSETFEAIGAGGSAETPEPFSVEVDLSGAALTGETMAIIAQGDTGLDGDPGEFSAIPVVVEV